MPLLSKTYLTNLIRICDISVYHLLPVLTVVVKSCCSMAPTSGGLFLLRLSHSRGKMDRPGRHRTSLVNRGDNIPSTVCPETSLYKQRTKGACNELTRRVQRDGGPTFVRTSVLSDIPVPLRHKPTSSC